MNSNSYLTYFLCPGEPGGVLPLFSEEHFLNLGVSGSGLLLLDNLAGADALRNGVMSSPTSFSLSVLLAELTWRRPG